MSAQVIDFAAERERRQAKKSGTRGGGVPWALIGVALLLACAFAWARRPQ